MGTLEGVLVGAATNVATDLIKALIVVATTAARCQQECNELKKSLETIQPGVEAIEIQLSELRCGGDDGLNVQEDWLAELKQELHVASINVHKCNTASSLVRHLSVLSNHKLAKKITAQNQRITRLADQRVTIHLLLTDRVSRKRRDEASSMLHKWNSEKDDILRREEITRLSQREREMNHSNSVHRGYGSSGSGRPEDSSHHESSSSQHHWPWH